MKRLSFTLVLALMMLVSLVPCDAACVTAHKAASHACCARESRTIAVACCMNPAPRQAAVPRPPQTLPASGIHSATGTVFHAQPVDTAQLRPIPMHANHAPVPILVLRT